MGQLVLFSTRAAAIAATIAGGVTELRTSGYAAADDGGGATFIKVGSQPSHPGKLQSTDGAWWEMVFQDGSVNVKQFGAKGDNTTDDWQAFADAQTFLGAKAVQVGTNWPGTGELRVPVGKFRLSQRLDLKAGGAIALVGSSGGGYSWIGSYLVFDASVAGIVVQAVNTTGDTVTGTLTTSGTGSRIENLGLISLGGTGAYDGIRLRTQANIRNVLVQGFPRDGVHIEAAAGSGGAIEGNANLWRVEGLTVTFNKRHGFFTDSADANAGVAVGINATHNGRWGIYDSSFLGNTYLGCHAATNGVLGTAETPNATETSAVSYGGNRYCVVIGQETAASTTTPGTNDLVWSLMGAGGTHSTIPAWVSGGTYVSGGPYASDDPNAANLFIGCYSESDQGQAQLAAPASVLGGLHAAGFTSGSSVTLSARKVSARDTVAPGGATLEAILGGSQENGDLLRFEHSTQFSGIRLRQVGANIRWDRANGDSTVSFTITGPNTALTFGRSAIVPDAFVSDKVFLGSGDAARNVSSAAAAPTSGAYARGDIVYNNAPSASGKVGWVCVTAGTPGTWKPFGAIDA